MLRITVELLPGGNESQVQKLGEAKIWRTNDGELADYSAAVSSDDLPAELHAELSKYPRNASTVWDLVLRAVSKALTRHERLPKRPEPISRVVPVRKADGCSYIRIRDIPEPGRTMFLKNIAHSTCPLVEEEDDPRDCAYSWDFKNWLAGLR